MFDSLYDLCTAIDNIGRVDMESYVRRILQVERVLFEVTWSTAMIDQFLRKVLSFAVIDKVTSFMDETTWGSDEAQRFTRVFSGQFLITRLPQIFRHPILQAEAASWLSGIYDDLLRKTHDHIFPGGIVSGGQVQIAGRLSSRLQFMAPGARHVSEEVFMGNLLRAIRNTHHGFTALRDKPFSTLMASSGAVSEQIASLLPLFAFAILDNPILAIRMQW